MLCPRMEPSGEEGFLLLPSQTSGMRGSWPLWQCLCSASRYSKQGSGVLVLVEAAQQHPWGVLCCSWACNAPEPVLLERQLLCQVWCHISPGASPLAFRGASQLWEY